jgi:hypothetical protein
MCTSGWIVVVAVLVLLPGVGSVVPLGGETVAVLAIDAFTEDEVVPLIVTTTELFGGIVAIVPLTVLPATVTEPGHTAPPAALPQLAVTPVIDAGMTSLNVVPLAAEGPALRIVSV